MGIVVNTIDTTHLQNTTQLRKTTSRTVNMSNMGPTGSKDGVRQLVYASVVYLSLQFLSDPPDSWDNKN